MAETVVVDACCLINLAAADGLANWLPSLGIQWMLPEAVFAETIYLRAWDENGEPLRVPVELQPHLDSRLFALVRPENSTEVSDYVAYAARLDDGEAMAIAIAGARGWVLATDDRQAISLAREAGIEVVTTAELVKRWADAARVTAQQLSETLSAIRAKARFVPGPRHPLYEWWMRHLPERG